MLLVIASGLGLVAPAVLGGFGTALAVGLSGAVSLALSRSLAREVVGRSALLLVVVATVARLAGAAGHLLVLVSATGLLALTIVAVLSLVLTMLGLTGMWTRVVRGHLSR